MNCDICHHPAHTGLRCGYALTEDIGWPPYGRTVIVGNCACGSVDAIIKELGINIDDLQPFYDPNED